MALVQGYFKIHFNYVIYHSWLQCGLLTDVPDKPSGHITFGETIDYMLSNQRLALNHRPLPAELRSRGPLHEHAASATYTPRRNVAGNDGPALLSDKLLLLLPWISAVKDKQSEFQDAASARRGK